MISHFTGKFKPFSNFYQHDGITIEHRFQAAKTHNQKQRQAILNAPSPAAAKRLGRKCDLRPDWEQVKYLIMYDLVRVKFQSPKLQELLLSTAHQTIVEGNAWHDNEWGNCTCSRCKKIDGKNWLGVILMRVREQTRLAAIDKSC